MAEAIVISMGKRSVVSTRATAPGNFCHLSVLDRLMKPTNQVKIVCYYPSSRENVVPGELSKKLRESLASVISDFPITNGRLLKNQEGHWMVKCNDGGLRIMEAKVKGSTVEDWLKNVDGDKELQLFYWEDMFDKPYFWPTFYVKVTEFEKGGVAIGLSCSHLLADPICATMFLKAWADITLSGRMSTPPFFHPLPSQPKANHFNDKNPNSLDLINHYKSSIERPTPSVANQKYATITFSFTDPMVRDCIAMSQYSTASAVPAKSFSPAFAALAALFWVSLSKVKGKLLNMSICLDMRNELGLDQGFFGNCMVYNKVRLESEVNGENMLPDATKAIGEVAKKMNAEAIKDLIEWLQCNDHNNQSTTIIPSLNGYDDLICANLEGVNPYLATFRERVEPLRVSYYVEPTVGPGRVQIFRSPPAALGDEGPLSRVVMATLLEDEIAMLCKDDLIRRFSPIVLMGTNKN